MISPNIITLFKRFGPWIAAIAILLFLFWRIDIHQFFHALHQANLYMYVPLIIFFIFVWFLVESQNLSALFNHFGHRISYSEVMSIRGSTYLLMILNYNLGVGGIAFYLKQGKSIPLLRSTSLMIFYMFTETVSLSLMSAIGCLFTPESSVLLNSLFYWCAGIFIVFIVGIMIFKSLPRRGFFQKIKDFAILKIFNEATLRSYLLLPIWRGLYFSTFIVFFYMAVKAFHMDIPLLTLAAFVPIIFFIGNIPITPLGLGTIQAAMLFFFQNYSSEGNILAFSITYSTSLFLLRALIGMFYLGKIAKSDAKKNQYISSHIKRESYEKI